MAYPLGGSPLSATVTTQTSSANVTFFPGTLTWNHGVGGNVFPRNRSASVTLSNNSWNALGFPGSRVWSGTTGIITVTIGPHWGIT